MTERRAEVGELETLVMLAVLRLGDGAHARPVRDEVSRRGGRTITRGAMYATLNRLTRKGFLRVEETTDVQAGRPLRRFRVTEEGLSTLRTSQQNLERMRAGLESLLGLEGS